MLEIRRVRIVVVRAAIQSRGDSMNSEEPSAKATAWIPAAFRALLDGAPDAMLIVDQEGRIVLANKQAGQLFGYADGELTGQKVEVLVPPRSRSKHPRFLQRASRPFHGRRARPHWIAQRWH